HDVAPVIGAGVPVVAARGDVGVHAAGRGVARVGGAGVAVVAGPHGAREAHAVDAPVVDRAGVPVVAGDVCVDPRAVARLADVVDRADVVVVARHAVVVRAGLADAPAALVVARARVAVVARKRVVRPGVAGPVLAIVVARADVVVAAGVVGGRVDAPA